MTHGDAGVSRGAAACKCKKVPMPLSVEADWRLRHSASVAPSGVPAPLLALVSRTDDRVPWRYGRMHAGAAGRRASCACTRHDGPRRDSMVALLVAILSAPLVAVVSMHGVAMMCRLGQQSSASDEASMIFNTPINNPCTTSTGTNAGV